jgi:MoaA/NifB/PqqE/SkfB family radical SAM enzyme
MDLDDFKKLLPYLGAVESVVLEGWGEALLHKNLIECVRLVKRAGARAGFVTSGKGLNEAYVRELVNAGTNFIGFSLAGTTARTHNTIRVNSDLEELLLNIEGFRRIKGEEKALAPKLHIVYLMLKDNFHEVPALVGLAHALGIAEIVLINLIQATSARQEEQRVYDLPDGAAYEETVREAESKARELNIRLRRPMLSPGEVAVCEENPLGNLYISVSGEVAPCVFLYPPTAADIRRFIHGREYRIEKVSFGNIFKSPFSQIWNNPAYAAFRSRFQERRKAWDRIYSQVWAPGRGENSGQEALPEPPASCETCPKIRGA